MDIIKLIDKMEELVEDSRSLPFGKKLIDEDKFFVLVNRIRATLPEEMKEAREISRERENILSQSQEEADAIMADARAKVDRMIADSDIVKAAEREAGTIIEHAGMRAADTMAGAERYAGEVLAKVASYLDRAGDTVRAAMDNLKEREADGD